MVKNNVQLKSVFDRVIRDLPWLDYESFDDFVFDAVRLRLIVLLRAAATSRAQPAPQNPVNR